MSLLSRIFENFIWRIEGTTPTCDLSTNLFERYDPKEVTGQESPQGMERKFIVYWQGSGKDDEPTDIYQRTSKHQFEVQVIYSAQRDFVELHEIMLKDRNDLLKALRDESKFLGYSDAHPTDDLRIIGRFRTKDSVDIDEEYNMWILKIEFDVHLFEEE